MAARRRSSGVGFGSKESRLYMTSGGLSDWIKKLPVELRREVSAAMRDGARQMRDAARENAPVAEQPITRKHGVTVTEPGTLKKSINFGLFGKGTAAVVGLFGRGRKAAWYGHFVEFGTKSHYNQKGGGTIGGQRALSARGARMMAGAKEQPFLRPAATAVGPLWAKGMIEAIRSSLRKAAAGGIATNAHLVPIEQGLANLQREVAALKADPLMDEPAGRIQEG